MTHADHGTQVFDGQGVIELALLGLFGLGPLVGFVVSGKGSTIEMGLGATVVVLVVLALRASGASAEPPQPQQPSGTSYRTDARASSADERVETLGQEDGT